MTTVTRIYRHHEAENSSRHFVPYLEHAQAPPPFSQPIKTVCPAEPTVYMGIFISPAYMHSTAIYKHRLVMAGAGPRVPSASRETSSSCVKCLACTWLLCTGRVATRTAAPPPGCSKTEMYSTEQNVCAVQGACRQCSGADAGQASKLEGSPYLLKSVLPHPLVVTPHS